MFSPFARCIAAFIQVQTVAASVHRLDSIVSAPHEPALGCEGGDGGRTVSGTIEATNVSHRYPGCSKLTLSGINFKIEAGQKIAVVGATGAGKSTLVDVLLGLESVESGQVAYDGVPVNHFSPVHLRSQIGVVLQDVWLFRGTIRENISLGVQRATASQIVRAAQLACIHNEIAAMPLGYETPLSDGGANLSGGQRQRLALARALLLAPRILILDEATSHLDTETEREIEATIRNLQCTRIVIAHRLSTVESADQILVLDRGELVECGTHAELLQAGGKYAGLMARHLSLPADHRQSSSRNSRRAPELAHESA